MHTRDKFLGVRTLRPIGAKLLAMAITTKDLFQQSLGLAERDRADLANQILESLEPVDAEAESAWAEEIKRRMEDLESGGVEAVPWEEVRAKLAQKLDTLA